jgi:hypothetical protein
MQSANENVEHCGTRHSSTSNGHVISAERRKFEEVRSRKHFEILQYNWILVPLGSIVLFSGQSLQRLPSDQLLSRSDIWHCARENLRGYCCIGL